MLPRVPFLKSRPESRPVYVQSNPQACNLLKPNNNNSKQNNAPCCRAITLEVWFKCENSEILKMVGVIKSHIMKIMTTSY